ncbi:unnamed protein product [Phaedon cochleariae]|uniref:THAP-type domain-containing protein n=1 Tax=Phaedon cochleariae TaxID=80249 RepID=A0A9P0DEH2_PHACE|nr:unnamed protein product [Phaedon cochleariae]
MPSQMKSCFLCKSKESNISYHRFPKDAAIRSEWIKFCNLNNKIDVHLSSLLLCSEHFSVQDFSHGMRNTCEAGVRRRLNKTAIPTLNKISSGLFPCYVNDDVSDSSNSCAEDNLIPINDTPGSHKKTYEETFGHSAKSNGTTEEAEIIKTEYKPFEYVLQLDEHASTITDIQRTDDSSERKLKKQQKIIVEQKKKIRMLQQKNRRFVKKISSLKQLLGHLKTQHLIPQEAGNHFLENCRYLATAPNTSESVHTTQNTDRHNMRTEPCLSASLSSDRWQ